MNQAYPAVGSDRLPWLTDEPKREKSPPATSGAGGLLGWAAAGLLLVAGASYWLGVETGRSDEPEAIASTAKPPAATVKLPEPRAIAPEVPIAAVPEVRPAPVPVIEIPEPMAERPVRRTRAPARKRKLSPMRLDKSNLADTVSRQRAPKAVRIARPATAPRLWPASVSQGAYGRIVRIGAFGSRQQAKLGWRRMQRVYPAVARLPATVVADRNSRGRTFYRFQIGTTSQAHSEVLCQRMEKMLRFSCAVVGLPWKAKVER